MYLLSDEYGDYKTIGDYIKLRGFLVDLVEEDLLENKEDADIVKGCLNVINNLMNKIGDVNYLQEQLLSYGYRVICLQTLYADINCLEEYCLRTTTITKENTKVLSDMLDFLHKEFKV